MSPDPQLLPLNVTLFRIEGPDGRGPWTGGLAQLHRTIARFEIAKDPSLYPEARSPAFIENQRMSYWADSITEHHLFGCETLADLRLWYPSPAGCEAMATNGATLATYKASDLHTIEAAWEVAFDSRWATRVDVRPLAVLHGS